MIQCPHGKCVVDCTAGDCDYMHISNAGGGDMTSLAVKCSQSCSYIGIFLNPDSISDINIVCDGTSSCSGLDINVEAEIVNAVNVSCIGSLSCFDGVFSSKCLTTTFLNQILVQTNNTGNIDIFGGEEASGVAFVNCNGSGGMYSGCCIFFLKKKKTFCNFELRVLAACMLMVLDVRDVEYLDWDCSGAYKACANTECWCPSSTIDSCRIATNTADGAQSMQLYVDEAYTPDFLRLQCNDTEGIAQEQLYDDANGSYYCGNGGASYCCPWTSCPIFNDPEMGFDTDLTEIDLNETEQIIDETAGMIQSSIDCVSDELCLIRCHGLLSCGFTTISTHSSSEVIVECNATYSCLSMQIVATETTPNQSITILCLGMIQIDSLFPIFLFFRLCSVH